MRTLLRFFAWAKNASRLFSFNSALLGENTGGRGPQCAATGPPRKSGALRSPRKSAKLFDCHTSEKRAHNSFAYHTSKIIELKVLYSPHIRENGGWGMVLLTRFPQEETPLLGCLLGRLVDMSARYSLRFQIPLRNSFRFNAEWMRIYHRPPAPKPPRYPTPAADPR